MQQFAAKDIIGPIALISSLAKKWEMEGADRQPFWPESYDLFYKNAALLKRALHLLEVPISYGHATDLVLALERAPISKKGDRILSGQNLYNALHTMNQICQVTPSELGDRLIICLRGAHRNLYNQDNALFGDIVDDVFPDAIDDIVESGKCLALERYTAAVFHLMRAMEVGVRRLAEELGATITKSNGEVLPWGVLVSNIKPKIDTLPSGEEQDDWLRIYSLLYSVNRAYRTKTAHPKASYTEEQATAAFHATKSFIHEMAERLSKAA